MGAVLYGQARGTLAEASETCFGVNTASFGRVFEGGVRSGNGVT